MAKNITTRKKPSKGDAESFSGKVRFYQLLSLGFIQQKWKSNQKISAKKKKIGQVRAVTLVIIVVV